MARSISSKVLFTVGLSICLGAAYSARSQGWSGGPTKRSNSILDQTLVWNSCSLVTGANDGRGQCATVQVPLNWNNPGQTIPFFVKRALGAGKGTHKQIWMISGGPGQSGVGYESLVQAWMKLDPSLDFYIPDHRGTGGSMRLTCPVTEQITAQNPLGTYNFSNPMPPQLWSTCLREISVSNPVNDPAFLTYFSMTNAAKDLGLIISLARVSGQDAVMLAASYGTFLAQRYLQVVPNQVSSIILSGIGAIGSYSALNWDFNHDQIGRANFADCGADPFCSGKLGVGDEPWQQVGKLLATLKANPNSCVAIAPDGKQIPMTYSKLRGMLAIYTDVPGLRDTLPALIYRIKRCSAGDKVALGLFARDFFKNATTGTVDGMNYTTLRASEVLQNVIITSEEVPLPSDATPKGVSAYMQGLLSADSKLFISASFGPLFGGYFAFGMKDSAGNAVPIYQRDQYFGQFPAPSQPMLLLNGTRDPSTPLAGAEEVASHYQKPGKYFFAIPNGGHGTFSIDSTGKPNCAMKIVQAFLQSPGKKPDGSCLKYEAALDFRHQLDGASQRLFGANDLWD